MRWGHLHWRATLLPFFRDPPSPKEPGFPWKAPTCPGPGGWRWLLGAGWGEWPVEGSSAAGHQLWRCWGPSTGLWEPPVRLRYPTGNEVKQNGVPLWSFSLSLWITFATDLNISHKVYAFKNELGWDFGGGGISNLNFISVFYLRLYSWLFLLNVHQTSRPSAWDVLDLYNLRCQEAKQQTATAPPQSWIQNTNTIFTVKLAEWLLLDQGSWWKPERRQGGLLTSQKKAC